MPVIKYKLINVGGDNFACDSLHSHNYCSYKLINLTKNELETLRVSEITNKLKESLGLDPTSKIRVIFSGVQIVAINSTLKSFGIQNNSKLLFLLKFNQKGTKVIATSNNNNMGNIFSTFTNIFKSTSTSAVPISEFNKLKQLIEQTLSKANNETINNLNTNFENLTTKYLEDFEVEDQTENLNNKMEKIKNEHNKLNELLMQRLFELDGIVIAENNNETGNGHSLSSEQITQLKEMRKNAVKQIQSKMSHIDYRLNECKQGIPAQE